MQRTGRSLSSRIQILHFLVFAFFIFSAACEPGKPSIQIDSAEAKLSPMFAETASVFMHIANTGNAHDTLVGAAVDMPDAVVELHDVKDGKMVKTDAIRIPAGSIVQLRPGGLHIMIFKLPATAKTGAKINLILRFERSGEKKIALQLMNNAAMKGSEHGH